MADGLYQRLDPIDKSIVIALRRNGRRPFREIARELGVSESMVRKRAHRLLDEGWMRILAISDPLALGVPVLATTYARVRPASLDDVVESLAGYDSVRYLATCVGAQNLVVESLHGSDADARPKADLMKRTFALGLPFPRLLGRLRRRALPSRRRAPPSALGPAVACWGRSIRTRSPGGRPSPARSIQMPISTARSARSGAHVARPRGARTSPG